MAFTLNATKGVDFVDRRGLLDEMYETLTSPRVHMGYALYGKRRVGKSSVLLKLQERLRKAGMSSQCMFRYGTLLRTLWRSSP